MSCLLTAGSNSSVPGSILWFGKPRPRSKIRKDSDDLEKSFLYQSPGCHFPAGRKPLARLGSSLDTAVGCPAPGQRGWSAGPGYAVPDPGICPPPGPVPPGPEPGRLDQGDQGIKDRFSLDPALSFAGGFGDLFNPTFGHCLFRADLRSTVLPQESVPGQNTNLGWFQQDFSFLAPVWQDNCNEWAVTTNVRGNFYDTDAVLPSSGRNFPEELWNIRFGTSYRTLFDNGWIAGGA